MIEQSVCVCMKDSFTLALQNINFEYNNFAIQFSGMHIQYFNMLTSNVVVKFTIGKLTIKFGPSFTLNKYIFKFTFRHLIMIVFVMISTLFYYHPTNIKREEK